MLPKNYRLHRRQEIEQTVRFGRRLVTPYMVIYWQEAAASTVPRLACVVGRRVDTIAVRRHRFQRLLRALGREVLPQIKPGVAMVWVGQASLQEVQELRQLRQSLVPYLPRLPLQKLPL